MKKIIAFFLTGFLLINSLLSTSASADNDEPIKETGDVVDIKQGSSEDEQIDQIRKAVEEKVEEEVGPAESQKKAFFGQISDLFNSTIVLQTNKGKKTAKLEEDVVIVNESRKKVAFEDLEIDSYVIAMGYTETPEKLMTKRVVVTTKLEAESRISAMGEITEIDEDTLVIQELGTEKILEVSVSSKTIISQKQDGEINEIDLDDLTEKSLVVVVINAEDDDSKALLIRILEATEVSPSPTPEEQTEETEE